MSRTPLATALLLFLPGWLAAAPPADPVARAVEQGVRYLRSLQQADGNWPYSAGSQNQTGATALAGLTLLECDVPASDPQVQKAAKAVREVAPRLTATYGLALAIMFLDRLGDPADTPLIQAMAVRLLAGQNARSGGWTYDCPNVLTETELRRLLDLPRPAARPDARTRPEMPDMLRDQLALINRQLGLPQALLEEMVSLGDNSNTQFAVLGLWIARRHGVPTDLGLALAGQRFRLSQNLDGGWGYVPMQSPGARPGLNSTPAMTCAGLLGLAAGHGVVNEAVAARAEEKESKAKDKEKGAPAKAPARDPATDLAVRRGLLYIGTAVGQPVGQRNLAALRGLTKGYYYLWSLERVAMIYGLKTIGKKDWYAWGSELLLANQNVDGSWQGEYPEGGVDTCFALLFLRRANLAQDLTTSLRGKIQDPGEILLKSGGVGGASLRGQGTTRSGIEMSRRPPGTPAPAAGAAAKDAKPEGDSEAARLATQLVKAPPERQGPLLDKLQEAKGGEYTQALAEVIPQLPPASRAKAREALAQRLARMTAATLQDKLQDPDLEIRRAAALATAMRDEKQMTPALIALLQDPEPTVHRAAYAALKAMTGQDFGPAADARPADREQAMARWKAWWAKQGGK